MDVRQAEQSPFAQLLNGYMQERDWGTDRLAHRARVPKQTIVAWRRGVVRRPRYWEDVLKVAITLGLDEVQADEFLRAARQGSLEQLVQGAPGAVDDPQLMRWLDTRLQGIGRQSSSAGGAPSSAAQPWQPYHNLPHPDYTHFVGRQYELSWLRERLGTDNRAGQVVITGAGGVGKSALVRVMAQEYQQHAAWLPVAERFQAIIWVSGKQQGLSAHGIQQMQLSGLTLRKLDDIHSAIARTLARDGLAHGHGKELMSWTHKLLSEQRTLLIIDNMETVADRRVEPFLRQLPMTTKVVITSRQWMDVPDVLSLGMLSLKEAEQLTVVEASVRQVALTHEQERSIAVLSAGLPLTVQHSVARLAAGESYRLIMDWLHNPVNELLQYCFGAQITRTREQEAHAFDLLVACSFFSRSRGASRQALSAIAQLSDMQCDYGLARLRRLSLVDAMHDRIVLAMAPSFMEAQAEQHQAGVFRERWIEWYGNFLSQRCTESATDVQALVAEQDNITAVLEWTCATAHPLAQGLVQRSWPLYFMQGHWAVCERYAWHMLELGRRQDDPWLQLWSTVRLGHLMLVIGMQDQGLQWLRRAEEQLTPLVNIDPLMVARVFPALGQALLVGGSVDQAASYCERSFQAAQAADDRLWMCELRYLQGLIACYNQDWLQGEQLLVALQAEACLLRWERFEAYCWQSLGYISYRQGRLEAAHEMYLHASLVATSLSDTILLARVWLGLAQVCEARGSVGEAQSYRLRAEELHQQLGSQQPTLQPLAWIGLGVQLGAAGST